MDNNTDIKNLNYRKSSYNDVISDMVYEEPVLYQQKVIFAMGKLAKASRLVNLAFRDIFGDNEDMEEYAQYLNAQSSVDSLLSLLGKEFGDALTDYFKEQAAQQQ